MPNAILGRMSALEMALFTVTEAVSSVFGGAAFDLLGLSLRQTLGTLTAVAGLTFGTWAAFAAVSGRRGGAVAGGKPGYLPVPREGAESS